MGQEKDSSPNIEKCIQMVDLATLTQKETRAMITQKRLKGSRFDLVPELLNPKTQIHFIKGHDCNGIVMIDECGTMWIAFGSHGDTSNAVRSLYSSNLQFADRFCHEYETPKVNSKCLQEYHSLRKQMDFMFDHQPKFLYSIGHSIGGAMAALAALDYEMKMNSVTSPSLYPQIKPQVYCTTFGVPKIGDAKFVEIFDFYLSDRYHRISKPNDLLVRYPVTSSAYVHLSNKNKNPKKPIPTRNRMTLFRQFLNGNEQHRLESYQRFVKKYFILKRSESVLLPKEKQYEILKNRSRSLG